MKKLLFSAFTLVLVGAMLPAERLLAQNNLTTPEASQKAGATQTIGLTEMSVSYSSPLVNGRKVWGTLVPYGEVWRAGANENTTISFSTDVMVEGKALAAGTYGVHMIPAEGDWTLILSKDNAAWGSYFYKKENDALRVTVKPTWATESQNWLSYVFTEPKSKSTVVELRWEKIRVPFKVEVDVKTTVLASMRRELTGSLGFTWQAFNQAAAYCVNNDFNLDEATSWINQSIEIQETFGNLMTKSRLMEKKGMKAEAEALVKKAMPMADEQQLNAYGYQLMGQKKTAEAIEIFKTNVKKYPASWNVYDSLAEAQQNAGSNKEALANYKLALAKAPKDQQSRISGVIKGLESAK